MFGGEPPDRVDRHAAANRTLTSLPASRTFGPRRSSGPWMIVDEPERHRRRDHWSHSGPRQPSDLRGWRARSLPAPTASPASSWATHSRSEEHTSELQSRQYLVCRLLLEKKKNPHKI